MEMPLGNAIIIIIINVNQLTYCVAKSHRADYKTVEFLSSSLAPSISGTKAEILASRYDKTLRSFRMVVPNLLKLYKFE